MPSPKNARKDPSKKAPEKAEAKELVLGQKLSQKKSQDFKSKIELWNVTGAVGGQEAEPQRRKKDATTPIKTSSAKPVAVKTPDSNDISKAIEDFSRKVSRDVDPERKAWVRRRSRTQPGSPQGKIDTMPGLLNKSPPIPQATRALASPANTPGNGNGENTSTPKRTVTPRKRVVSDEHWRKDRPQQKYGEVKETREKESTPKPKVVRRSVASVGLKVPPSVQDFKDVPEPSPALRRQLRRHDRNRSTSCEREDDRAATPDYESSGTKVFIKRRRRSKPADGRTQERIAFNTSENSFTARSSVGRPSSATDVTTPETVPARGQARRSHTDPHLKVRRFLDSQPSRDRFDDAFGHQEDGPRRLSGGERNQLAREDKVQNDRHKSTDAPESAEVLMQPEPKVYGSRIEGWLAGMPDDPFTDSTDSLNAPERLEVSHMVLNQHNSNMKSKDDALLAKIGNRGERPVPRADDPDEYEMLASSQSLRRNGARRSSRREAVSTRSCGNTNTVSEEQAQRSLQRLQDVRERYPPGLGNRLSTIASVSTLREQRPSRTDESVISRASDGDKPTRHGTVVRSRRTKHSDLMSVLSLPREDDHALAPARSIRTRRPRHDFITSEELMNEVTADELKYQRELRTLVDGVIPVLLQYVLAQSNKSGSRRAFAQGEAALTQPIVDMGVALERLKACHKRIPMHDPNELLLWAENAAKVYSGYVNVWRLGFSDVVVNLAPAEQRRGHDPAAWDDGLQRNEHGDLLDGDGERVDVAYLLKRPLIRIKDLSKTLKGINQIRPSLLADNVLQTYEDLVSKAKQRTHDERARLEDEAAAGIDPNRARDPRSLAPLAGVSIDPARRVRARDFFDLEFFHSSGQQLDCRIEIIMRDDPPGRGGVASDILICEISPAGRWLLFPPLLTSSVSSRYGDKDGELVIMIRGKAFDGTEWRELLSLQSTTEQSAEWLEMLGSDPLPLRLTRRSSFNTMRMPRVQFASGPSSSGSDLPIGERARPSAPRWDGSEVNSVSDSMSRPSIPEMRLPMSRSAPSTPSHGECIPRGHVSFVPDQQRSVEPESSASQAARRHARSASEWVPGAVSSTKKGYGELPSWERKVSGESSADENDRPQRRPTVERRTSSVPSINLPTVHKLRQAFTNDSPAQPSEARNLQNTPPPTVREPSSAPAKLQKRPPPITSVIPNNQDVHGDRTTSPRSGGLGSIPSFTPAFLKKPRRSSSPLKHEYEPSTATESSESEFSEGEDNDSITSESSAEEAVSTLGELRDFSKFVPLRHQVHPRPPETYQSSDDDTIRPSESASLAPYRAIPMTTYGSVKSVACLFSWSDTGTWESMHPEECQIVVTPGLIEAFDLAQASAVGAKAGTPVEASPSTIGVKPLVALELTPWVPLRRGTAVDISIRSPPTADSVLRKGNNIMFRSRSPEECEKLYNLINRARIDNPTWMALQYARGPVQTSNWGEVMDRRNDARTDNNSSSWLKTLSRKGSTYRSKGTRSASIAGSQSSIGTINSAFSAIRQFSGSSKIFNIAKSTIMSKHSTRSSHSDSLSSGLATPLPVDTSMGTPVGITNTKIRLYVRESTTKWRDLGNAHLTVMLPPRPNTSGPADPRTTGLEKRILICGKKDNVILDVTLGEHCFERVARTGIAVSVWEEDIGPNGEVGFATATGGVVSSKSTVYMVQMKSEREAAYTFSMVGKLRY